MQNQSGQSWELGPSVFVTITAVDKWLFGCLSFATSSLESDSYQAQFQPIATRFLPDEWYVRWGDFLGY